MIPDNLKKLQQDCITESLVVWSDDSWALPRTNRVYIDKDNPRIEVVISVAPFIGIFDNEKHFNQFVNNCKTCKRYKNNCSILREVSEGRIHIEVDDDFNCSKYNPS